MSPKISDDIVGGQGNESIDTVVIVIVVPFLISPRNYQKYKIYLLAGIFRNKQQILILQNNSFRIGKFANLRLNSTFFAQTDVFSFIIPEQQ